MCKTKFRVDRLIDTFQIEGSEPLNTITAAG